jgi:uncharacterized protein YlxW (UPF0749 family)
MPKQAKDQPSEGHALEQSTVHDVVHSSVPSVSPDQLDELKKQYATLQAQVSKLEARLTKLENPTHIERAIAKHLKRNLGISGQPARGDQA